jgi:hypothetical protein
MRRALRPDRLILGTFPPIDERFATDSAASPMMCFL